MCFGTIMCGNRVIKHTCPLTRVSLPECCWGGNDGPLACSLQTPTLCECVCKRDGGVGGGWGGLNQTRDSCIAGRFITV